MKNKKNLLFAVFFYCSVVGGINAFANKELPTACTSPCVTTFGAEIGKTREGISAFSNCQRKCVNEEPVEKDGTYLGIKWQCVEFARRWLFIKYGAVFPSIDWAYEIWSKIDHLIDVSTKQKIPLISIVNGSSEPPKVGNLLIYAQELDGTGHVAIITEVDPRKKIIRVAEQNFSNGFWTKNYAREIPLIQFKKKYWILDSHVIGWKSYVPLRQKLNAD